MPLLPHVETSGSLYMSSYQQSDFSCQLLHEADEHVFHTLSAIDHFEQLTVLSNQLTAISA